jgi:hypothetical protein
MPLSKRNQVYFSKDLLSGLEIRVRIRCTEIMTVPM